MITRSSAKINLFLHVTGRRPDGYHDLYTLMCGITVYDRIEIDFSGSGISVTCPHQDVPDGESNIAFRAAELFYERLGKDPCADIRIEKNIPVAAGLGGGSGNGAAVLTALNEHHGFPFSQEELMRLGLRLGADVPFFIFGGPALATGVGEKLARAQGVAPYHVLLVNPGVSVSTAEVYKNLKIGLTKSGKITKDTHFEKGSFDIKKDLWNDLEPVTESMCSEIGDVKASLYRNGAEGVLMSGSGPTVFGLFTEYETARKAKEAIGSLATNWRSLLAELIL